MSIIFLFSKSYDLWNYVVLMPDQESPREKIPGFTLAVMNQNLWSMETRNLFLKISPDSEDYQVLRTIWGRTIHGQEYPEWNHWCVGVRGIKEKYINEIRYVKQEVQRG